MNYLDSSQSTPVAHYSHSHRTLDHCLQKMTWASTFASVGMAVGPPLVYADQARSIIKRRDATGFSRDVPGILLVANITRCMFWIGKRFEFALLIQSILMIFAQLGLLYICLYFKPKHEPVSDRPFTLWQWPNYSHYIEFLAALIVIEAILVLIFGRQAWFVDTLGFLSLGLESTLPIPQLISNFKQKSLYGFSMLTLLGWLGGDGFKTAYFFFQDSPLQFRACAIFQLSIDVAIVIQRIIYGARPPPEVLPADEDVEQALRLDSDLE